MNEEANRKLLEYFGFKPDSKKFHYELTKKVPNWLYPDGTIHREPPDFFGPDGLGWLFRYVVPLFDIWHLEKQKGCERIRARLEKDGIDYFGFDKEPQVALANAILKWLESEKK